MHPMQDLFLESFSYELQLDMHSYLHKNFILAKSGCYNEEKSSQKIIELEALCKKLREDTQRLEEEKSTLEGMVESRDVLLLEIAWETVLDRMGEDAEDEGEDEDAADDDGGDAAHHLLCPLLPHLKRSTMKALWR
jgi:hypothetical protein